MRCVFSRERSLVWMLLRDEKSRSCAAELGTLAQMRSASALACGAGCKEGRKEGLSLSQAGEECLNDPGGSLMDLDLLAASPAVSKPFAIF